VYLFCGILFYNINIGRGSPPDGRLAAESPSGMRLSVKLGVSEKELKRYDTCRFQRFWV